MYMFTPAATAHKLILICFVLLQILEYLAELICVCSSVLQCVSVVCCSVLQILAELICVCSSVLQCVAVCCSVLL